MTKASNIKKNDADFSSGRDSLGKKDHDGFKDAKVRKGLAEAEDRSQMISVDKVWEKLGLER